MKSSILATGLTPDSGSQEWADTPVTVSLTSLRHDGAVAFLGDHHRVAAIQRQVVVGRRVAFEVIGDGVARGFLGGVYQQIEIPGQRQFLFLDHLHGVERDHDAVLVILGAPAIHAIAHQGDLERVEPGAILQHPVLWRHRYSWPDFSETA
jgi:hypothetical protein